jgi:hypothetical protein
MHIQVGGDEALLDDSRVLEGLATAAGVDATLDVVPGQLHTFQMAAGRLPRARRGRGGVGGVGGAAPLAGVRDGGLRRRRASGLIPRPGRWGRCPRPAPRPARPAVSCH